MRISKKIARDKYGILTSGANRYNTYELLSNGDVIDDTGSIRYSKKDHQNALMDALNIIDEQAEQMGGSREECEERAKAYKLLADFIQK